LGPAACVTEATVAKSYEGSTSAYT
jgi:hypothetical protein